jgi:hypothetical protein
MSGPAQAREKHRQKRPANARVIHLPVKTRSRAGIEYTHYKPFLQRLKV